MEKIKVSHCAFVVIKLKLVDTPYWLMRRNERWKDVNFIGGHATDVDKGNFLRTARRELLEEVPAIHRFKSPELIPLTENVTYGPLFSKSARQQVQYQLRFYSLRFTENPQSLVEGLLRQARTSNLFVRESDLFDRWKHQTSGFVKVLTDARKSKGTEEGRRFAPKASRRPSTVTNSGEWRENENRWRARTESRALRGSPRSLPAADKLGASRVNAWPLEAPFENSG